MALTFTHTRRAFVAQTDRRDVVAVVGKHKKSFSSLRLFVCLFSKSRRLSFLNNK